MTSRVSFCLVLLVLQATSNPKPQFPELGLGAEWGSPAGLGQGQGHQHSQGFHPSQGLSSSNPVNIVINCGGGDSGSAGGGGGGGCNIGEY